MPRQVISFHYVLSDDQGKTIEASHGREPLTFLEGEGLIIPGLEAELLVLKQGDKKEVNVPHLQAYGAYNQSLIYEVDKSKFPSQEIKVGDVFQIGNKELIQLVTVVDIKEQKITLDANHPLAGKNLTFNVEIVSKREASAEEIAHGHVHGAGGHHH